MYSTMHDVARATLGVAELLDPPGRRSLLDPRNLMRAGLIAVRHGAESIDGIFRAGRGKMAFQELDNRIRAVRRFEAVSATLAGSDSEVEAIAAVELRYGREGAVWASEGIGYEIGRLRLAAGAPLDPLPKAEGSSSLPGSWGVLHTGAGMALGESLLADSSLDRHPGRTVRRYLESCEQLARPGEAAMIFEPLGFVVRLLRPRLVPVLHDELQKLGGPWLEHFWHGVGRGLYFLPADLSPLRSAPWRGWRRCAEEAPSEWALRNLQAGFAWAVTLVNLETPAVVELLLARHAEGSQGIGNGIGSALRFWEMVTGGSRRLRLFLGHVAASERRPLWKRSVLEAFAACRIDPGESWSDLYRYRS